MKGRCSAVFCDAVSTQRYVKFFLTRTVCAVLPACLSNSLLVQSFPIHPSLCFSIWQWWCVMADLEQLTGEDSHTGGPIPYLIVLHQGDVWREGVKPRQSMRWIENVATVCTKPLSLEWSVSYFTLLGKLKSNDY